MSRVTSATESTGVCTAKKTASSNIPASLGHGRRRVFGREKQVKVGRVDRALERRLGFVIALLPFLVRRTPASARPRRPTAPRSGRCTALPSPGVLGSGPRPAHALGARGARAPHARVRGGGA